MACSRRASDLGVRCRICYGWMYTSEKLQHHNSFRDQKTPHVSAWMRILKLCVFFFLHFRFQTVRRRPDHSLRTVSGQVSFWRRTRTQNPQRKVRPSHPLRFQPGPQPPAKLWRNSTLLQRLPGSKRRVRNAGPDHHMWVVVCMHACSMYVYKLIIHVERVGHAGLDH